MKIAGYLLAVCLLLSAGSARAVEMSRQTERLDIKLISNTEAVNPAQNLEFLIRFKMKDGWHIFSQNPGEIGMPTSVKWQLPQGYLVAEESWSRDEAFETDGIVQRGYGDVAYYKTTIQPHSEIFGRVPLRLTIRWLACKDECVPGRAAFEFTLPVSEKNLVPTVAWDREYAAAQRWFLPEANRPVYWGSVLILAFLGGLILNFMPCILPILTIKAISLAQSSYDRRKNRAEALLYTLGVLFSFMLVASVLLLLRLNGEYVGWGFQLQSPVFVSLMMALFLVIALLLLDILHFNNPLANAAGRLSFNNRLLSSFMTGFLAVLIASPCTAPFMGIAIGYTLSAPAAAYYPVFLALGLGYALPFALVHLYPQPIHKILPKPGKWMLILKKIMAVPVLLTVVWLGWVLYAQLRQNTLTSLDEQWMVYDEQRIAARLRNKQPVFIDFTAKWCLTCLLNKKTSLQSEEFAALVKKHNIALYTADWTNNDAKIAAALAKYGRNSIPLYVYYDGKSDDYLILPPLLTPQIIEEYLQ